jgi:hypothetical protein
VDVEVTTLGSTLGSLLEACSTERANLRKDPPKNFLSAASKTICMENRQKETEMRNKCTCGLIVQILI